MSSRKDKIHPFDRPWRLARPDSPIRKEIREGLSKLLKKAYLKDPKKEAV